MQNILNHESTRQEKYSNKYCVSDCWWIPSFLIFILFCCRVMVDQEERPSTRSSSPINWKTPNHLKSIPPPYLIARVRPFWQNHHFTSIQTFLVPTYTLYLDTNKKTPSFTLEDAQPFCPTLSFFFKFNYLILFLYHIPFLATYLPI
jgi:hypothetical protein